MERSRLDILLTVVIAVTALVACRSTCCPTYSGCCERPIVMKVDEGTVVEPQPKQATWLDKRVRGLRWDEVSLDQAATYLTTITGKSIIISPTTRAGKLHEISLTLDLDDVAVRDVLGLITEPYGLRWDERENAVWIRTVVAVPGEKRLRYHDLRDLAQVPSMDPEKPEEVILNPAQLQAVVDGLKREVYPDYWDTKDGGVIERRNAILIVRAPNIVQSAIEEYLTRIRKGARPEADKKLGKAGKPPKPKTWRPVKTQDPPSWLEAKRVKGLKWEDVDLRGAVAYLRTITGRNFYITPKVVEAGLHETKLTLALDDVPVSSVLGLITEPDDMRWAEQDGVVKIMTADEHAGGMRLRYYDIKDLVMEPPAKQAKPGMPQPAPIAATKTESNLVSRIRREVQPKFWSEAKKAAIEARNGILIVRAPTRVHKGIEALLNELRRGAGLRAKAEATQINLAISNTTVADTIKTLQIMTGLNLVIDPRFPDAGKQEITGLKLKDTSLWTALQMVASAAGEHMGWEARGNVLLLTRTDFTQVK